MIRLWRWGDSRSAASRKASIEPDGIPSASGVLDGKAAAALMLASPLDGRGRGWSGGEDTGEAGADGRRARRRRSPAPRSRRYWRAVGVVVGVVVEPAPPGPRWPPGPRPPGPPPRGPPAGP